jgi:pimeloyl-ACP methyl ester carboxylesterase
MPAARQQAIAVRMPAVGHHFGALFRELALCRQVSRLALPMLFLSGSHSVPAMRQVMELVRKALPRARHQVLDGVAHMGPIANAVQVNAKVADFLDERVRTACEESAGDGAAIALQRAGLVPAG